jgi:hypothetical protein
MPRRPGSTTLRMTLLAPGMVEKGRPFISSRRAEAHTVETVLVGRLVNGWLWLAGNFDGLPVILLEGTVVFAALSTNGGVSTSLSCDVMRPRSGFARYPDDCWSDQPNVRWTRSSRLFRHLRRR